MAAAMLSFIGLGVQLAERGVLRYTLVDGQGVSHDLRLSQKWPVRRGRLRSWAPQSPSVFAPSVSPFVLRGVKSGLRGRLRVSGPGIAVGL